MGSVRARRAIGRRFGAAALGFVVALAACGGQSSQLASSEDDESTGSGGSSQNGGSGTDAGEAASGGTSAPTGGAAPTTGQSGASSFGGSFAGSVSGEAGAPGGTAGSEVIPPPSKECLGIRANMPCSPEGVSCEGLPCGIAETGRRTCNCATNWTCSVCDYTDSPIRDRIPPYPACPVDTADDVACAKEWDICGPIGTEHCVCFRPRIREASVDLIWDCDSIPACWCP